MKTEIEYIATTIIVITSKVSYTNNMLNGITYTGVENFLTRIELWKLYYKESLELHTCWIERTHIPS